MEKLKKKGKLFKDKFFLIINRKIQEQTANNDEEKQTIFSFWIRFFPSESVLLQAEKISTLSN